MNTPCVDLPQGLEEVVVIVFDKPAINVAPISAISFE